MPPTACVPFWLFYGVFCLNILYNCLSDRYKQPFGCLRRNQVCSLLVEVPVDCPVIQLEAVLARDDGYGMRVFFTLDYDNGQYRGYRTEFSLPRCGLYHYYFHFDTPGSSFDLFRQGESGTNIAVGDQWQLTCCPEDFETPEFFNGAVMYQIFPDRFYKQGDCDLTGKLGPYWVHDRWEDTPHYLPDEHGEILNNDFFGGNLNGVRAKLDYLSSLGVDVIYFNPLSMAFSNHRYDTADYKRPDPMLGTEADFAALCRDAHALGMKVILDGVYSHTGSNSVYFDKKGVFGTGALSDPQSPYRSWFDFQHYPDRYTSWWGIDTLPCVNEMDPSYLDYMIYGQDSVIAHWLALGADGFRLDVADELPDEFIVAFRKRLKELNPNALLLGEVWEDASNKVSYSVRRKYFSGGELDSVMNYPFRNAILTFMADSNAWAFRSAVMTIVEHYPAQVINQVMNSLSTHDTPRILTLLGDSFNGSKAEKAERFLSDEARAWAVRREKAAAVLQFTLPGMPCIYYGDEAGLEGFEDPLNRRTFPWGRELTGLQDFYRSLSKLKHNCPALKTGSIAFQSDGDSAILYTRKSENQSVRTVVNGGQEPFTFPVNGQLLLLHCGRQDGGSVTLEQWGAAIILEG